MKLVGDVTVFEAVVAALWFYCYLPADCTPLKYVTLGESASRLWKALLAWAGWSTFFGVCIYFEPAPSPNSIFREIEDGIPPFAWFIIAIAAVSWSLRGLKLELRAITVREWLFMNALLIVAAAFCVLIVTIFDNKYVTLVSLIGIWRALHLYAELVAFGKAKVTTEDVEQALTEL